VPSSSFSRYLGGMSNSFFAVPADLYNDLRERRHLRRLADVLVGTKKPSTISLERSPALSTLTLVGDAWEQLPSRLVPFESINRTTHSIYLTEKFATPFAHGALRPAAWHRREVLMWLSSFNGLVFDVVVAAARARGEAGGGATSTDGVTRIQLDTAALIAADCLKPPYVDSRTLVAPESVPAALAHVAAHPGSDVASDLGALVPFFTDAFVGSWAPGHPWAALARNVVVRVPT